MNTILPSNLITGKSGERYHDLLHGISGKNWTPCKFLQKLCGEFGGIPAKNEQARKSIVGRIFEFALAECFVRQNIGPFYYKAELKQVKGHTFDFLFYRTNSPIAISAKVSIAERWKQAAYEGLALRVKYPQSKQYLITSDSRENADVNWRIANGRASGIDGCLDATTPSWNEFLSNLGKKQSDKKLAFQISSRDIMSSRSGPLGST